MRRAVASGRKKGQWPLTLVSLYVIVHSLSLVLLARLFGHAIVYTFCVGCLPMIPAGLKIRIRTSRAKANTSS